MPARCAARSFSFSPPIGIFQALIEKQRPSRDWTISIFDRDGINIARFAMKLKSLATDQIHEAQALELSILQTLGEEALRYTPRG